MDLAPFKLDIDELLNDFVKGNCTTMMDMKRIWMQRKFSYIYESKPNSKEAFFMQSLYDHCFSHMVSTGSLSQRLGALYCLYCLYETQTYKPCFKIYLSTEKLKGVHSLVVDAQANGIGVVPALVKRMLEKNIFLLGFVDIDDGSMKRRVNEITRLQNKRIQLVYDKLFTGSKLEESLYMDLGTELDLQTLKKMSSEYCNAKAVALIGDTNQVDTAGQIVKHNRSVVDTMENIVEQWNAEKDAFYKKTGVKPPNAMVAVDDFFELEQLLND